ASSGNGSSPHMAGGVFRKMTGGDMNHVPYRRPAPPPTHLPAGQVHVKFPTMPSSIEYVRAGKHPAPAGATSIGPDPVPAIPPTGDFVPGYESSAWLGLGTPKNTPAEIIDKLNREINAGLADPKIKMRLADLGGDVLALSPADFGRLIADETEKWAKVIRAANIKAEGRTRSGQKLRNVRSAK